VLGPEHAVSLAVVGNLAAALFNQGKHAEAEVVLRSVLEARRRVLGADHLDTLNSSGNLANALCVQGKHVEAEAMYHQLRKIQRRVLGPEHPDTLWTARDLAVTISCQGNNTEAETMFRETLDVLLRVLGPEHPATMLTAKCLASCTLSLPRRNGRCKVTCRRLTCAQLADVLKFRATCTRTITTVCGRVCGCARALVRAACSVAV
jgi:hypothetical protein